MPQGITWKHNGRVNLPSMAEEMPLQEAIQRIIDRYAENPKNILIDPSVFGRFYEPRITASSMDAAFEWILARFSLSTIYKNEHWRIVPKKEVWRQVPYHKLVISPIPLDKVLNDFSHVGQITIMFDQEQAKQQMISRNLLYPTVEKGITDLVTQFGWITNYDEDFHTLYLTKKQEIAIKNFSFETIIMKASPDRIEPHLQSIFRQNKNLKSQLVIHWEKEKNAESALFPITVVSLYGDKTNVQRMTDVIKKLDRTYQKSQPLVIKRFDFKYLHVKTKTMLSEGQTVTIPGVETKLQQFFQQNIKDKAKAASGINSLKIIPDFVSNSVILQGTKEQVHLAKELLIAWDKPQPLIKIEAHIFETSDTVSRELGAQFGAQGFAEGAEVPNATNAGEFTAGAILGPLQTTTAFQVDALLRFIETRGKGRVLSRPVVVTTNNIEAEMRSGNIINVKVVIEDKPTLKEIKTGVALRVTPRLITETKDGTEKYKIRLNVFAESSGQINQTTEGIPQINSQTARSQVIVRNGEPFLLGGLIRSNLNESDSGVPLLKDIPLLGYFFKTKTDIDSFNHILVFVTPTLVSSQESQVLPDMPQLGKPPAKALLDLP